MSSVRRFAYSGWLILIVYLTLVPAHSCLAQELNVYFGDLHAHTSFSDGSGTPEEAYSLSRDTAKMDFLYLSDHGYFLRGRPDHWEETKRAALAYTRPGTFVAGYGAEWTNSTDGHINVFAGDQFPDRDNQGTHHDLFRWLHENDAIAQFAHPNFEYQRNWDAFEYSWIGDQNVHLIEVGSGHFANNIVYEESYQLALNKGWRLGAVAVSDTHRPDWGVGIPVRTGIWAKGLTLEDLNAALRARRTFATEDSNATMLVKSGEHWMGSTLPLTGAQILIQVTDPDGEGFEAVQLISRKGMEREIKGDGASRITWKAFFEPGDGYEWVYFRAIQDDGDKLVSSPLWFENDEQVIVTGLGYSDEIGQVGREARIVGKLVNHSDNGKNDVVFRASWRSDGQEVLIGGGEIDLGPGDVQDIAIPWTPMEEGQGTIILRLVSVDGVTSSKNTYSFELTIYPETLPRVMLDEGHNNRYTGASETFLSLLRPSGYEVTVNMEPFQEQMLKDVSVLIIANPEEGFSILPNYFSEEEIAVLTEYVHRGGNLILAGASDASAVSRENSAELNRILDAVGSSIRIADNEVRLRGAGPDGSSQITAAALPVGPWAKRGESVIYLQDAASLIFDEARATVIIAGTDAMFQTDANGSGNLSAFSDKPVLGAYEAIGDGVVVVLGAPAYSVYELDKADNQDLVVALVDWLVSRDLRLKGDGQ